MCHDYGPNGRDIQWETTVGDEKELNRIFKKNKPTVVMHLAAETHVDRSIDGPINFIKTNIVGSMFNSFGKQDLLAIT